MGRTLRQGVAAGFRAVLLHRLAAKAGIAAGVFGRAPFPYNTASVPPFGVPAVLSAAFWGGVRGVALAALLRGLRLPDLLVGFVFVAPAPTSVAFTLVALLKGLPPFAGGNRPGRSGVARC